MLKLKSLKTAALTGIVACMLFSAACGKPANNTDDSSEESATGKITETNGETTVPPGTDAPEPQSGIIKKLVGAANEAGIYTVGITLSDTAADKGTVEMVYYGAKGTPQEDSVVNTFRIEYCKDDAGTFEINTFSDGDVYLNMHQQKEVKVINTFGAGLRAGRVEIFYTPDGGDRTEICKADAEQFFVPTE